MPAEQKQLQNATIERRFTGIYQNLYLLLDLVLSL